MLTLVFYLIFPSSVVLGGAQDPQASTQRRFLQEVILYQLQFAKLPLCAYHLL